MYDSGIAGRDVDVAGHHCPDHVLKVQQGLDAGVQGVESPLVRAKDLGGPAEGLWKARHWPGEVETSGTHYNREPGAWGMEKPACVASGGSTMMFAEAVTV